MQGIIYKRPSDGRVEITNVLKKYCKYFEPRNTRTKDSVFFNNERKAQQEGLRMAIPRHLDAPSAMTSSRRVANIENRVFITIPAETAGVEFTTTGSYLKIAAFEEISW